METRKNPNIWLDIIIDLTDPSPLPKKFKPIIASKVSLIFLAPNAPSDI